jgi:hypothetical protein
MGRRHFKPEQIIHMLREAEIKLAGSKTAGDVCRELGQPRSTQRRTLLARDDENALARAIVDLASEYGRFGYRRINALLCHQGWHINHKRVERIWRREGLKVTQKQPKRGRLWLNDGSCVRRRPQHRHHVLNRANSADVSMPLAAVNAFSHNRPKMLVLSAAAMPPSNPGPSCPSGLP